MEQPDAAERHGNAVLIAGVNNLLVADRAAGLDNGGHAGTAGTLDVVAKGEEGIGTQADTGNVAQVLFLFLRGQGCGLLGEGLGPDIVADDILGGVTDIHINGIVAVGLGDIVTEGQVQHLVHVAQLPIVGLLACQTGAVDAALLAGTHADGLTACGVADTVGLGVFQGDKGNDQVPLLLLGHALVLGDPVGQHGVGVDGQLVAALLKGDAVHLLVFHRGGLVVGVNGHHIVVALFLAGQNGQSLRLITGGNDAVRDLMLDELCGGHIADIGEGDPVAKGGHTVSTAGTGVSAGQRVQIEGNRSQVGNLDANDMIATPVVENVTSSGVKTLDISVSSKDGTQFTVKSISPKSVNVRFDKMVTKKYPIQGDIGKITSSSTCVINTEDVKVTPNEVEVTGPETIMNRISYAAAVIPKERELSATTILTTDQLEFRDENDTPVESTYLEYTLSNYAVEIPVQYTQTLDITYQLRNVPTNFDEAYLRSLLKQSEDHITLATSDANLDAETAFSIGQISLSDIGIGYSKDFPLEIPENYENLSGVTSVNLALDASNLVEKEFVVTDISIMNAPTTYNMTVDTSQLTVKMIGPKNQIEHLSAADLTVTINLLGAPQMEGESVSFSYTPTISCEKWDRVWAVGDYTNKVYVKGVKVDTPVVTTTVTTPERVTVHTTETTTTTRK